MTNAEEKLIEILKTHHISDAVDCAKAIIKEFPQIEAKKAGNRITKCLVGETVEMEIFVRIKE